MTRLLVSHVEWSFWWDDSNDGHTTWDANGLQTIGAVTKVLIFGTSVSSQEGLCRCHSQDRERRGR